MDLGAEMAAGGQAGKGQGPVAGDRLSKELSTNWLRPASGNLATGLASEAPSFRSSWQAHVNAWRGVSRGTNGVENEEASEATTVDTKSGAPMSLAAKDEQTSVSVQVTSSSLQSNGAVTKQNVSIPDVAGQMETLPQRNHSPSDTAHSAGTQTTSTGSAVSTATARPGTATRSRVGSATPPAEPENTAQAATVGAQTIAPAIEAPIQVPAAPARSQIPALAQTAETSFPESNFALSNWRSTHLSGLAQLSGAAQFSVPQLSSAEEIAGVATGRLATGATGGSTAAGVRTHTTQTGRVFIPRNATGSEAMHETVASALDDADEPVPSQQTTSLCPPEASSAESWHEPPIGHSTVANGGLSGQPVPTSSPGNLDRPATAESIASYAAPLATVSGQVQASADTVQDNSRPFADRATLRATNRDTTGESVSGATQVSATPPIGVDAAASSGLRIPGVSQISTASAPHDQPAAVAVSAAATTQDTFSALDAGTSPGEPAWTHAGSQHAEAGFRDPALGWVSVRADLDAGGIHATVVPGSAEAAQALNGHLAGLSTHLAEQQSPVASLTIASPSESAVENGMGQRMQQGAEGYPQRNAPEEAQASAQENAPPAASNSVPGAPAQAGIRDLFTHTGDLRGTHISVMA